eukprot:c28769_g1_i1 orf=188-3082(-)
MMKVKNFRRRADDEDSGEADDAEVKPQAERNQKSGGRKDKEKERVGLKSAGTKLLSFAEDEESVELSGDSISNKAKKDRVKEKPASRSGLLSFGVDDQDGDVFFSSKAKKRTGFGSTQGPGHKLSSGKDKRQSITSNFQPQAGEYTKEKLLELQKNTRSLGGSKTHAENEPTGPVVVLKNSVKPPVLETEDSDRGSLDNTNGKGGEKRASDVVDRLRKERDDAESRLGLMGIGAGAEGGGITHIPDAAAIAAAKAKRERLRQAQYAPDYIPLGNAETVDFRSKLREPVIQGEEALSSDDETEIQGRLALMGEKKNDKSRGGVFELVEDRYMDSSSTGQVDEDKEDEERRWEEEQLRKGFGKRVEEPASRAVPVSTVHQLSHATGYMPSVTPSAAWGFPGRNMEGLSVTQQAEVALRTLQESAQRMRETYGRSQSELHRIEDNISVSSQNITTLEKSLVAAGEKYIYMQKLRDYIAVLCDFLKSKIPLIEELEEHLQRLHEERATAVMQRRLTDNADEMAEAESAIGAAMAVLSRGAGMSAAASAAAVAMAAVAAAKEGSNIAPQLDEFGRDINLQKRMEAKRRAQDRERRIARASAKRSATILASNGDSNQRIEGESSSDESDSEQRAFQSGHAEVLETAEQVLGDAADEYAQLLLVKERLEEWKRQYSASYRDAYLPFSAPAIFSPYVRLELLKWDPLHEDADFNNMKWHSILFDYGVSDNGMDANPDDADLDLVPKLVETVALPILHHEIAHCWDKLSTSGTRNAVSAVQIILNYVPASSEALQELLAAVRMGLAEAVAGLEVPAWGAQVMVAVAQASRIAAHRFGTSVRLLRNITLWKDVLAMPVLEQLALDDLMCGKMLPHLRSLVNNPVDAVTRTERVVAALSGIWVGPNFTGQVSPKLEPLVDYLMSLGRSVEKRKDGGVLLEDVLGLARRLKRMLVELNEYDRARRLSKTFQLKEAL